MFFGGLLVLVLFAALIGPYFVDWSSYRQDFEREAGRILGQKVKVLGEADARLLPFPSVTFDNVVVGEGQDGAPMMTIETFSMDAELAPFLSGEIRIFDMRIEKPVATVRLSDDGELDWALRSDKALPGKSLVLENIRVSDARILIVDDQNGREHLLDRLNMKMSAKSIAGPWQMDGDAELNGYKGGFSLIAGTPLENGSIRLRARLMPENEPFSIELEGDAQIEDLKPQYKGSFLVQAVNPQMQQNDPTAKGKRGRRPLYAKAQGVFELDNERLRIEDYRLETGSAKDPYVISGEATLDTGPNPEFLLIADGQQLNISSVGSDQDTDANAGESKSLEQRLATLRSLVSWAPVPQMPGRVSMALPAIVTGDTTIRDVLIEARPDGRYWKVERLEAKFPGRTQFLATGQLGVGSSFGFSGEVIVASNQPSGFASWLTDSVDPAIRKLEAAGLSAKVDLSTQLQRFDQLEIAVGSAQLKGRLERVVPIQGRPSLSLQLDGDEVDADALRAFAGLIVGDGHENRLADHDISARLSADTFLMSGVLAKDADLSLRLKGGTLDIDRLTVNDLSGASISGVGRLENIFDAPIGEVDMSVMVEQSGPLLTLVSKLGGEHPVLDHLRDNARLFGETNIDVETRLSPASDGKTTLKTRLRGRSGGSRFDVEVERQDAMAPISDSQISLTADVSNNTPRNLLGQMAIGSLPIDLDGPATVDIRLEGVPSTEMGFSFAYDAPDTKASARGSGWQDVDRQLQGNFRLNLTSDDLTTYLPMNGINLVDLGFSLPVAFESDIETDTDTYKLTTLSGKVGDTTFSGNVTIQRGAGKKAASGSLSLSEIDMAWIAETMLGSGTVLSGGPGWSGAEFLQPLQGDLDLDLDIRAQTAGLYFGPDATDWSGKLVLNDNEFQWRNLSAEWLGGRLEGNATLANRGASGLLSGQIQILDADLGSVMWKRDGFPVASGNFNLSASVEGTGKSMRAMIASLTGSGILETRGLDLEGVENESLALILDGADEDGFEVGGDNVAKLTDRVISNGSFFADEATVPFTIAAGTLRMPNVVLTDNAATLRGGVRINLVDEAINARFDVEFDPEDEALTGAAPALSIAFLGPLADPDRSLDVAELSNFLSLRAYERERRRVEILQAVVLENQRMRRESLLAKVQERNRREAAEERKRLEAERAALQKAREEQAERERIAAIEAERLAAAEARRLIIEAQQKAAEAARLEQLIQDQQRAAQAYADKLLRERLLARPEQDDLHLKIEDALRRVIQQSGGGGSANPLAEQRVNDLGAAQRVVVPPIPAERGVQTGERLPELKFDTLNN